ncbi:MAG: hypothetical protein HFI93_07730 [Lachnospiraceae bacterium]|nr:hypothetical protein [Lachnospiraceae bacterium]
MENDKLPLIIDELREQKKYLKKQTRLMQLYSGLLLILIVTITAAALFLGPQIADVLKTTQTVTKDLEKVASELEGVDISGMLANVNDLVSDSQATVQEALRQMQAIDIETLNEAIDSLYQIINPLSSLFRR